MPAVSSFIAMNFTGSSTYTSLSGVVKEMRIALPIQITGAFIGTSVTHLPGQSHEETPLSFP